MKNEFKSMSRQEIIDVIKEKVDSLRATIEDVKEQTDFDISINLQLLMSNGNIDNFSWTCWMQQKVISLVLV
ncbi:TPA: DUF2482 family protein [Staphylococcus aureus]